MEYNYTEAIKEARNIVALHGNIDAPPRSTGLALQESAFLIAQALLDAENRLNELMDWSDAINNLYLCHECQPKLEKSRL